MFMKEKNIKFKSLKKQIFYIGDFNKMNEDNQEINANIIKRFTFTISDIFQPGKIFYFHYNYKCLSPDRG